MAISMIYGLIRLHTMQEIEHCGPALNYPWLHHHDSYMISGVFFLVSGVCVWGEGEDRGAELL